MNLLEFIKQSLSRGVELQAKHDRYLPWIEVTHDRWDMAKAFGFGPGTSIYPSARLYGLSKLKVGSNVWIGPNVLLDATGGLSIGDWCSISAGVHIYTHNTVGWAITGGKAEYEHAKTSIADNCFIGPSAIIQMGTKIRNNTIVIPNSVVKGSFPELSVLGGNPAKKIGETWVHGNHWEVNFTE